MQKVNFRKENSPAPPAWGQIRYLPITCPALYQLSYTYDRSIARITAQGSRPLGVRAEDAARSQMSQIRSDQTDHFSGLV